MGFWVNKRVGMKLIDENLLCVFLWVRSSHLAYQKQQIEGDSTLELLTFISTAVSVRNSFMYM